MQSKFFILALPRSRTYWLKEFLNTKTCRVEHDGSQFYSSMSEMLDDMKDGIIDTMLITRWKELPGRVLLIDRDVTEILSSFERLGLLNSQIESRINQLRRSFDQAMNYFPCYNYNVLNDHMQDIWCQCTNDPWDQERFDQMRDLKLNKDLGIIYQEYLTNMNNINNFYGELTCSV